MRILSMIFFTIILLNVTGCEKKEKEKHIHASKYTSQDNIQQETNVSVESHFMLHDRKNRSLNLVLTADSIRVQGKKAPIILLNFIDLSSTEHIHQMAALSKLQKKYSSQLIVISMDISHVKKASIPYTLLDKYHITHFVSTDTTNQKIVQKIYQALHNTDNNTLPYTVIYKNQKYISDFEGDTPIEMIRYDIQQLLEK